MVPVVLTRPLLGSERSLQFTAVCNKESNLAPTCSPAPYHVWLCCITICHKAGKELGNEAMCTHDTMQPSGSLETK